MHSKPYKIGRWSDLEVQLHFLSSFFISPLSFDTTMNTHTIYSVFQVQILQDSDVMNETAAASSVNVPLEIQILIAPFAILQSNITVTLSITTGSTATGVVVTDGLAT